MGDKYQTCSSSNHKDSHSQSTHGQSEMIKFINRMLINKLQSNLWLNCRYLHHTIITNVPISQWRSPSTFKTVRFGKILFVPIWFGWKCANTILTVDVWWIKLNSALVFWLWSLITNWYFIWILKYFVIKAKYWKWEEPCIHRLLRLW